MPLSPAQVGSVQGDWNAVYANKKTHGEAFCMKLFENADIYAKFQSVKGWTGPATGLKTSDHKASYENHAVAFMDGINGVIANLSNPAAKLQAMKTNHDPRGVSEAQFNTAWAAFIEYLKANGACSDSTAWTECGKVVVAGIKP